MGASEVGTAGTMLVFLSVFVGTAILSLIVFTYATYCLLVILTHTAAGDDEFKWPGDSIQDVFWIFWYFLWIVGIWAGPSSLALRPLNLPLPWHLGCLVAISWLVFPLSLLSSLSSTTRWIILQPSIFPPLFKHGQLLLRFYFVTGCGLAISFLAFYYAVTGPLFMLLVAATYGGVSFFVYARLLGRLGWLISWHAPKAKEKSQDDKSPEKAQELLDFWPEEHQRKKATRKDQGSGVRNQESGGRRQETGVRDRESGVGAQESGVRKQGSGSRGQEAGVRGQSGRSPQASPSEQKRAYRVEVTDPWAVPPPEPPPPSSSPIQTDFMDDEMEDPLGPAKGTYAVRAEQPSRRPPEARLAPKSPEASVAPRSSDANLAPRSPHAPALPRSPDSSVVPRSPDRGATAKNAGDSPSSKNHSETFELKPALAEPPRSSPVIEIAPDEREMKRVEQASTRPEPEDPLATRVYAFPFYGLSLRPLITLIAGLFGVAGAVRILLLCWPDFLE